MLYLVRHGRTVANAESRLQGRLDPDLDEVGHRQAAAMAEYVGSLTTDTGGIATLVASPLVRAHQTAGYFGEPIVIDERWMEMNYGDYEGHTLDTVPGDIWQRWYDDPTFAVPGGESFQQMIERVEPAASEWTERARDTNVVVVSHVGPIKAALAWVLGVDHRISFRCHLSHGALCQIAIGRFGPLLKTFNQTVDPDRSAAPVTWDD